MYSFTSPFWAQVTRLHDAPALLPDPLVAGWALTCAERSPEVSPRVPSPRAIAGAAPRRLIRYRNERRDELAVLVVIVASPPIVRSHPVPLL